MSSRQSIGSERRNTPRGGRSRRFFQFFAAVGVGLLLFGVAYDASFARSDVLRNIYVDDDDDDGLTDTEKILIGAGALGLIILASRSPDGDHPCVDMYGNAIRRMPLPDGFTDWGSATEYHLCPHETTVGTSEPRVFDFQVRVGGHWFSLTNHPNVRWEVVEHTGALVAVPVAGSNGVFTVPEDAPQRMHNQTVKVVVTFTQPDGTVVTQEADVKIQIDSLKVVADGSGGVDAEDEAGR